MTEKTITFKHNDGRTQAAYAGSVLAEVLVASGEWEGPTGATPAVEGKSTVRPAKPSQLDAEAREIALAETPNGEEARGLDAAAAKYGGDAAAQDNPAKSTDAARRKPAAKAKATDAAE